MTDAAVQAAIYKMGLDPSDYQRGSETVQTGNERIIDSFTRMEAKYDPLIRAEQRRQAAIAQATRFLEEGQITQERYAQQIARVNAFYEQQTGAAGRAGAAIANTNRAVAASTGMFNANRFAIQNAAFQVGDFAVQMTTGTNVIRALTQQGAQFLGVFGPWGAIIGAAGAIVGALVMNLDMFGDSAKDGTTETDKFTAAQKRMEAAVAGANRALFESQGFMSTYAQGMADLTLGLAVENLQRQGEKVRLMREDMAQGGTDPTLGRSAGARERVRAQLRRQLEREEDELRRQGDYVIRLSSPRFNPSLVGDGRSSTDSRDSLRDAEREAERAQRERERAVQTIEEQIEALGREADQIGMTARERAIDVELQKAEATARRGNIELTADMVQRLQAETIAKFEAAEAEEALKEAQRERVRLIKELEREQDRAAKELERDLERQRDLLVEQGQAVAGLAQNWRNWEDVALSALEAIINELLKLQTFGGEGGGLFGIGGLLQIASAGVGAANLGGSAPGIPPIKPIGMAQGGSGIVDKPTLFLAGEGGRREKFKFTPLPQSDGGDDGPRQITIDLSGAYVTAEAVDDLRAMIHALSRSVEPRAVAAVERRANRGLGGSRSLGRSRSIGR